MSFRETREMLLLAYDSKIISDEEFLVLWESCRSKNPHFPYSSYARFDLENIHGFIDGSVRPIARPDQQSRIVYNGHKRVHLLKFQSVTPPNGLIGICMALLVCQSSTFFYYKDLGPDFHNIVGCFLVESGSVLPCFFV